MWYRLLAMLGVTAMAFAQTTQGLVTGQVVDVESGEPVSRAEIQWYSFGGIGAGLVRSAPDGTYVTPPLSPGTYRIRAMAPGHQAQEVHEMDLAVAGRIVLDFRLQRTQGFTAGQRAREIPLAGSGFVVTYFGPDIAPFTVASAPPPGESGLLEAAVSEVVDRRAISSLPLAGRDVYTLLAMQAAVASDTGTSRGLGLAIAGQRPASANFLLDGLEANQSLTSGPALAVSTDAVSEYRVSTSNYSAEFGGTAGAIANAVTVGGGTSWHGSLSGNYRNEALNGNGFQENRLGLKRARAREWRPGTSAGGPLRRDVLFLSGYFEYLHSAGRSAPVDVTLPGDLRAFTDPDGPMASFQSRYAAPAGAKSGTYTVRGTFAPPVTLDRFFGMARADWTPGSHDWRAMLRVSASRVQRPDFLWSPYPDFVSGLDQPFTGVIGGVSRSRPGWFLELRAGLDRDDLRWSRAHPEIATLMDTSPDNALLPGSLAFYGYSNRTRAAQMQAQSVWTRGRHIVKAGAGLLARRIDGDLSAGSGGGYTFGNVIGYASGWPDAFLVSVDRAALPALRIPDSRREYGYAHISAYVQEDWRAASSVSFNLGLRFEHSGAPANLGAVRDLVLEPGEGASLAERLGGTTAVLAPSGAPLFHPGAGSLAPRAGVAVRLRRDGRSVFRAGWGLFFDRPFDNLWQTVRNNRTMLASFPYAGGVGNFLEPASSALARYRQAPFESGFPAYTLIEPDWKAGRASTWFAALSHEPARGWRTELRAHGSAGRRLVTTDIVNRPFSRVDGSRINSALPDVAYRGNQGASDYYALAAAAGYRGSRGLFRLAYTWAHAIDNQSDALASDFFDLTFARAGPSPDVRSAATFTRQFDPDSDRASADFDQRHNLVGYGAWRLPAPAVGRRWFGGWTFGQLAAIRSGFPFTVLAPSIPQPSGGSILRQRADLIAPSAAVRVPVAGGYRLLDVRAFATPPAAGIGNLGRNSFGGPGMYNLDLSLSRIVELPGPREGLKLILRVDAFNALNHANLNQPDMLISSPAFGQAAFGRKGKDAGFPALTPFRETARQLEILVRIEF